MKAAIKALNELCEGRKRAPSLKQLAEFINEWLPKLEAKIVEGYCDTDRKIGRLRWPGKGRTGNKIVVEKRRGKRGRYPFYEHNAADTYRHNGEVVRWIAKQVGHKDPFGLEHRWVSWYR